MRSGGRAGWWEGAVGATGKDWLPGAGPSAARSARSRRGGMAGRGGASLSAHVAASSGADHSALSSLLASAASA